MKLSVAMIVRDEAAMLPGCLASLGPCDLVVVDTGSKDDTKAIAAAAGARVLDFAWRDDFSAARNFSLEQCRGDLVLMLDADERVSSELWQQLTALGDDVGAATVLLRNVQAHGHVRDARLLRVFRRDDGVRFRYPIHEDISQGVSEYLARTGTRLVDLPGAVQHLGYEREHMAKKGKRERDQRLLEQHLASDPSNLYSHFKLLELARFWADQALSVTAAQAARGPLEHAGPLLHAPWAGELAVLIANALWPGSPRDALQFLESVAARIAPSAAWHLRRAELLELLGKRDDSRAAFAACTTLRGQLGDLQLSTVRPRMGLARLAIAEGKLGEALAWAQKALTFAPDDPEAKLAMKLLAGATR